MTSLIPLSFLFVSKRLCANKYFDSKMFGTFLQIACAIFVPNIGGFIKGKITDSQLKPWFESLKKPIYNPPNWLYAPVWTIIFTLTGYASYLVWRDGGFGGMAGVTASPSTAGIIAISLYCIQFVLNMAWTPIFFTYHSFIWVSIIQLAFCFINIYCGL